MPLSSNNLTVKPVQNDNAPYVIRQYLQPEEILIWTGQPKKGMLFEGTDTFRAIYFSGSFAVFGFIVSRIFQASSPLAILIGCGCFAIAVLLCLRLAMLDVISRKRTFYGLTNKRIIIRSDLSPKITQTIVLHAKLKVEFLPSMDDTSTIDLGIQLRTRNRWVRNLKASTSLYRLTDAALVHQKIREIVDSMENNK